MSAPHIMPPVDKPGSVCAIVESIIDRHGLVELLTAIECICSEKAVHVLVNWQDKQTSQHWARASTIAGAAARKVTV